jgi:SMODS and SLOG-associating 2TM effector domain
MSEKQPDASATSSGQSGQSGNYEHFCRRVGIWPMSTHDASVPRSGQNKGTYKELIHTQAKTRIEYYTTASLINMALVFQIIIAAVVTAVSASNGPRVAITVLGALNTVLAGSLTWVKGQGLPDRLVSYANELRRVREHIEDLERQYEETPNFRLNVEEEARKIYDMYDSARKNAENAYLGTFKNVTTDGLKGDWKAANDKSQKSQGKDSTTTGNNSGGLEVVSEGVTQPPAAKT